MKKIAISIFFFLLLTLSTSCSNWAIPSFKLYVGLDTNPIRNTIANNPDNSSDNAKK